MEEDYSRRSDHHGTCVCSLSGVVVCSTVVGCWWIEGLDGGRLWNLSGDGIQTRSTGTREPSKVGGKFDSRLASNLLS